MPENGTFDTVLRRLERNVDDPLSADESPLLISDDRGGGGGEQAARLVVGGGGTSKDKTFRLSAVEILVQLICK